MKKIIRLSKINDKNMASWVKSVCEIVPSFTVIVWVTALHVVEQNGEFNGRKIKPNTFFNKDHNWLWRLQLNEDNKPSLIYSSWYT